MKKFYLIILAIILLIFCSCSKSNDDNLNFNEANETSTPINVLDKPESIDYISSPTPFETQAVVATISPILSPTFTPITIITPTPSPTISDDKPIMHITLENYDTTSDKKYQFYEAIGSALSASQEDLERLIREYVCGEWVDANQVTHIIASDSFDDKSISIFGGMIYNNNCFGFWFNFTDKPLNYPLFLQFVVDGNYILIETSTGDDHEDSSIFDSDYYVEMQWLKENATDENPDIPIYENQKYTAYYEIIEDKEN